MTFRRTLLLLPLLSLASFTAHASAPFPPSNAKPAVATGTHKPAKTPPRVTSLAPVEVKAHAPLQRASGLQAYGNATLHDTPAAITVVGRRQLDDTQVRSLAGLTRFDAALGDGYAPIGYIQNLSIRGYPLNLANGYRIDNLTVTGQQYIAYENKQQVQILQGLAGIESGVMQPGGVINFVTRAPANVQTASLGTDSHGSRYAALDFGRWLTPSFGVRFDAASEAMHAFVDHAHGHRHFYAIAAEWRIAPRATLQIDSEYQGYAQRS
ncbi:MAG TPA: TonB-dependent receptor plug domain-containing protein, partial [Rhodanobacteraceae bacterium]